MASGLRVQVRFKRWDDRAMAINRLQKELDFQVVKELGPEQGIEGILQDLRFVNLAKGFGNIDEVTVLDYRAVHY
jgi:hypothetical protein